MSDAPVISSIVCTRNRPVLLEKCLKSLLSQSIDAYKCEILVIDNGSTDNTSDVISKYANGNRLRYIHEPKIGLSNARNTGWRLARGKYIGFIDDDATASKCWLESALWCFEHVTPRPDGLTGPILLDWEVPAPAWINDELKVPLGGLYWGSKPFPMTSEHNIIGANCFFSKNRLLKFDGFDSQLGRKGKLMLSGEETQLQRRIEADGGYFYYHPEVQVKHYVPAERVSEKWFYRRYFWGGITDYYMKRSLKAGQSFGVKKSINFVHKANVAGKVRRLAQNTAYSLSIGANNSQKIWGRIYLSYCLGFLAGGIKSFAPFKKRAIS